MNTQVLRHPFEEWVRFSRDLTQRYELFLRGFHHFKPQIKLRIETPQFVLQTAERMVDLQALFQLRHSIFNIDFKKDTSSFGLDYDTFDHQCDHLMILDKMSGEIVGTYRLRVLPSSLECYTGQEFDLRSLPFKQDRILELGRACIAPRFRKTAVLQLLWRGIAEYATRSQSQHLIGCTSVMTLDPLRVAQLVEQLDSRGWVNNQLKVSVQSHYQIPGAELFRDSNICSTSTLDLAGQEPIEIPGLLLSYLRAGAQVILDPAFDREYNCTDLLTHLDFTRMSSAHRRRFFGDHA